MNSRDLLKSRKLLSEIRKYRSQDVFDIVVYGSIIRGKEKSNDIDIAVILNKEKSLDHKLTLAQQLRKSINFLGKEVDVKVLDIKDFLDPSFIARQAILAEGFSLLHKKFLHELFGFSISVLFTYSLSRLSYSKKKMFYYALKGRRGQKGLLEERGGKQISDCAIEVPLQHLEEFQTVLHMHDISFKLKYILTYKI